MVQIILASASLSRKRILEAAGILPRVLVSNVYEEAPIYESMNPKEMVLALAIVKAHTIREIINEPCLILACDSTFEFEGESLGKPLSEDVARERASRFSGKSGLLHTGHCLIDLGKEIELASGVAPDDRIITAPPDGIADGDQVRVVGAKGKPATASEKQDVKG